MTTPKRVAVTGAAGQIGYSLLPRIARGDVFGTGVPIVLQCLEIPPAMDALRGVAMELQDCAFPLLHDIVCTDDPKTAFKDADLVLLVGSKPRGKGMERKDLILENGPIFTGQGRAINDVAGPDVRVLVVGNPCNTNALICMHSAPDVPRDRFSAMTRLDQNRAVVQLAERAGTHWSEVRNVIIWGNHSNTQYPDWHHATIAGQPVAKVIVDDEWLRGPFIQTVQQRGKAIIDARGLSSAMSAANAATGHARDLFSAKGAEDFVAMAVLSDGSYGTPEGLISSFPCTTDGRGNWSIVQGLEMDPWSAGMKKRSTDELEEEREIVAELLVS